VLGSVASKTTTILGCIGGTLSCLLSAFAHTFYVIDAEWALRARQIETVGIVSINFSHFYLDSFLLFMIALGSVTAFISAVIVLAIFSACVLYWSFKSVKTAMRWNYVYPMFASIPLTLSVLLAAFVVPQKGSPTDSDAFRTAALNSAWCSVLVFISGGVFFVGKVPERLGNPYGMFDYANSHTIFHIGIVLSILAALEAVPFLHILEGLSKST
jgi:hypothetical protein